MGCVVSVTSRPLFSHGDRTPVPIVQEAVWTPEQAWAQRLEEKFFHLCRGSNIERLVIQSVAIHYTD
jgi:hypothetical protein